MMASSSAMTTRTATGARSFAFLGLSGLDDEAVEQLVLGPFELGDRCDQRVAAPRHGVGVALGFVVFTVGEWGLLDQCPEPGIVGGFHEYRQLFVENGKLVAGAAKAVVDLLQLAFDQRPRHAWQCIRTIARDDGSVRRWLLVGCALIVAFSAVACRPAADAC